MKSQTIDPEQIPARKTFDRIVDYVRKNPFQTQLQISQALGLSENTVSKHCKLARQLGIKGNG